MPYPEQASMPGKPGLHPLDDVTWRALTSVQRHLADGDERARRYSATVAPFAATVDMETASLRSLLSLLGRDDRVALFTAAELNASSDFTVIRRASVDQMVLGEAGACAPESAAPIMDLGAGDVTEMLALVTTTQPGPFGPRTIELGDYVGIRWRGELVAMAGERMRLDGYTEISAVCVHPAHRGRGFAAGLVRSLAARIVSRSEVPFLHVFSANNAAIALYRKLGFELRRRMHLVVLGRNESRLSNE